MTSPQQIEILDIRHFSAKQLRPLLDQEAGVWLRNLRWDYRGSTDLLLQYLDSRILPGFVALDRGRVCGYTFCVYEGHKAVIGDLYAAAEHPHPLPVCHSLAQHLLDTLSASPDITRIEAQLLLFGEGVLEPIFSSLNPRAPAFRAFPRYFLEHSLAPSAPGKSAYRVPGNLELCAWHPGFYQPAAELIHAAYLGHIDSTINDQYRTLAGSLRFLHNIVRFPGCGTFDPQTSFILREQYSNSLVAVVLCSKVAPDTAHITQLCVAPKYRERHLGSLLLECCMNRLRTQRYRYITLTVSAQNDAAVRLYTAAQFTLRHRFDALVLDKQPHRMHLV